MEKKLIKQIELEFSNMTENDKWRMTSFRKKYSEEGICEGFLLGVMNRRGRNFFTDAKHNKIYPYLHKLLDDLAKYHNFEYNCIQVNKSIGNETLHQDENNYGISAVMSFGTYNKGGKLYFEDIDDYVDIYHKFTRFDGKRYHKPEQFCGGDRYSVVFFTMLRQKVGCSCRTSRCLNLCRYKRAVIKELQKLHTDSKCNQHN